MEPWHSNVWHVDWSCEFVTPCPCVCRSVCHHVPCYLSLLINFNYAIFPLSVCVSVCLSVCTCVIVLVTKISDLWISKEALSKNTATIKIFTFHTCACNNYYHKLSALYFILYQLLCVPSNYTHFYNTPDDVISLYHDLTHNYGDGVTIW